MYRSHINSAFTYCSNLLSTHVKYGAEVVTRFVNDQSFPVTMSNRSYAFESLFTMPNPADVAGSSRWLTADKNAPESPVVLPFFRGMKISSSVPLLHCKTASAWTPSTRKGAG